MERELSRRHRVWLACMGAAVGVAAGLVVTLYRLALSWAEEAMRHVTTLAAQGPLGIAAWACALAGLLLLVGELVRRAPLTAGSGIPQVELEVAGALDAPWARVLPAKFAEGVLGALAGLSLGREGPSVQIGGMAAKLVSRTAGVGRGEERVLVTCGAASGMAAAFQAPLTGVMFALEEIHKVFSAPIIVSAMVASVVADLLATAVLGRHSVLSLSFVADLPPSTYLAVAGLGVALGLLGALHNWGMFRAQELLGRIRVAEPFARLAPAFALAGVAAFLAPELLCGGDGIIELLQRGYVVPLGTLAALLAGKYLLTAVCFGSGAPGGTLLPLVVMGALAGCIYGIAVTDLTAVPSVYVTNFVVLGVAGLFASVVRAPITGIVLAFELTGTLDSMLAAAVVSVVAYVTADLTGTDAFYEHLVAAMLPDERGADCGRETGDDRGARPAGRDEVVQGATGAGAADSGERVFHRHVVGLGSPAEGMAVRGLGLPQDALVVTVTRAGSELVPKGETYLAAFDELLVLETTRSEAAAEARLAELCQPSVAEHERDAGEDATADAASGDATDATSGAGAEKSQA